MKTLNLRYLVKVSYNEMIKERYLLTHHKNGFDYKDGYEVPYKELHYIYYRCLLNASKKVEIPQSILFSFYNEWDPINAYRDHMKNPIGYIIAERIKYLYEENFISSRDARILLNELSYLTKVSYSEKVSILSTIKGVRKTPTLITSSLKEEIIKMIKGSVYKTAFFDNAIRGWHPILSVSGDWVNIPYNYLRSKVFVDNLPYSLRRRVERIQEQKMLLINKIFEDSWCSYTKNNSNNIIWWENHLSLYDLEGILNHEYKWAHKE